MVGEGYVPIWWTDEGFLERDSRTQFFTLELIRDSDPVAEDRVR